jgi:hypothetical protein
VDATPNTSILAFFLRALTFAIGCSGLVWGIYVIPGSEAADDFRDTESRLLHFETYRSSALTQTLQNQASLRLEACDVHSQRALLLMEMPLAEAALQSGAANEFDKHIRSLETRARQILSCAPRDAFVWLLAFSLDILHGRLDDHSFNLLGMSYDNSPNEAWISVRRIMVAMPLVLIAPEPLRQKILGEFQQLIRFGFVNEAARSYLRASAEVRSLLKGRIDQLEVSRQSAFSETLQRLGS